MKKIFCVFFSLNLFISWAAPELGITDVYVEMQRLARYSQLQEILNILNAWVQQYPQCYEDVANICELVSLLQSELSSTSEFQDSVSSFLSQSETDILGIQQNQSAILNYLQLIAQQTSDIHDDLSSLDSPVVFFLSDLDYLLVSQYAGQLQWFPVFSDHLASIAQSVESLTHLSLDGASVEVSNLDDIGAYIASALDDIVVRCALVGEFPLNVSVSSDFIFDYDWFQPLKNLSSAALSPYFTLNDYTRYYPTSWRFNSADSLDQIIRHTAAGSQSYDILDFLCGCGNALVAQNQDMSMLLCQILGALKGDSPEKDELRGRAQSAVDDVQRDHDSLISAFGADSLQSAADRYFVDLNIDDKFDTDFLGFAHGAGNVCPDYIYIGPIPFSKIYASMTDYTLQLPTAGLLSFFDVCRQCFTVIWYLFFLTICIFLARFGWAFLKPVFGVISNILNW